MHAMTVLYAAWISYWIPKLQCDSIWKCSLWEISRFRWNHEGWASHDGIHALRRDQNFHCHVRTQCKAVICKSGEISPGPAILVPWSLTYSLQTYEKISLWHQDTQCFVTVAQTNTVWYTCQNLQANINTLLLTNVHSVGWAPFVAQLVKNAPAMCLQSTWVQSLGWEDPLEKGKTTHSSILARRIPWTL